ncbi:hypothetical protein Tdes44962_MAKER09191 [Teratosphaeria destructans]|uniref:Uncharacterized protein n=1 Tax=Teratosphaeria destructans TaxID=418781 RepID=A0A9W7STS7_9PEZI|nr:hypothetical protein Tdes44962_MAKER09191 [Teratosphaeria destructans]
MPRSLFKASKIAKRKAPRKAKAHKSSPQEPAGRPSGLIALLRDQVRGDRTWVLTEDDKLFDAYGKANYKVILHIRLDSIKQGTDWIDSKSAVPLDKIFPEQYHPMWLSEGKSEAARNPQFWRRSILGWIHAFVEAGATKAQALKYITFHVDERVAGRGSAEQKESVGRDVPGMTSWDMVAAFHNFRGVKKSPARVLPGSVEEREAGRAKEQTWDMSGLVEEVEEMRKLVERNRGLEEEFALMKIE